MESFKKGLFKITQLGYFKIEEDPDFRVNPEKKTVDVTIKGIDTNRNEIQFGAGYSQLDGVFGQFQFSTRNFLGRGDTISVQFQRGGYSNYFDLSFVEPWFLDKRMSIGGSIFNRNLQYSDVDQRSKGVNASLGFGLGLFDGVSLFYGFTDTKSRYEVFPPSAPPGGGHPAGRLRRLRRADVGDRARLPVRQPERPVRPDPRQAVRPVRDGRRRSARRRLLVRQAGRERDATTTTSAASRTSR